MSHTRTHETSERRKDISKAADSYSKPTMFTCPSCGKKTAVGKTSTAIGGGNGSSSGAGAGGGGGGGGG